MLSLSISKVAAVITEPVRRVELCPIVLYALVLAAEVTCD